MTRPPPAPPTALRLLGALRRMAVFTQGLLIRFIISTAFSKRHNVVALRSCGHAALPCALLTQRAALEQCCPHRLKLAASGAFGWRGFGPCHALVASAPTTAIANKHGAAWSTAWPWRRDGHMTSSVQTSARKKKARTCRAKRNALLVSPAIERIETRSPPFVVENLDALFVIAQRRHALQWPKRKSPAMDMPCRASEKKKACSRQALLFVLL